MTAAAIASIFGDTEEEQQADEAQQADEEPVKADRRQEQIDARNADRAARLEAKAEAKAARAEEKAAAKAARDERRAAARAAKAEQKAAAQAARLEQRAAASEPEPVVEVEVETETETDVEPASEPLVRFEDPSEDSSERPIAVAAKLQQDKEDAERAAREAREAKEQAAQAKREAQQARKAEKAEADAARQKQREEAAEAKAAAKREREEAKTKTAAAKDSVAARQADDDRIVEAPREPKKSLAERLRPTSTDTADDSEDTPSNVLPTLAVIVGALGFVFSVILAVGAFMVALNPQDDGGLFNAVSNVCDALVGPLRGVFSFSGVNGESKDALVAWGLGALGYLVLGLVAQSFLRSRAEDE